MRTAFPPKTCLQFPGRQPAPAVALLQQLRDLFGKPAIHREDALRQTSIRAAAALEAAPDTGEFVRHLQGCVTFDGRKDPANQRLLELINKTNQFNLNGVRFSEGEWMRHLADPWGIAVAVSYEDKFGPLGVVGVAAGRQEGARLELSVWVMSCRAFSRRIEHHTLEHLFRSRGVESIALHFRPTARNQPLAQFLQSIDLPADGAAAPILLSRAAYLEAVHELPHRIVVRDGTISPEHGPKADGQGDAAVAGPPASEL